MLFYPNNPSSQLATQRVPWAYPVIQVGRHSVVVF